MVKNGLGTVHGAAIIGSREVYNRGVTNVTTKDNGNNAASNYFVLFSHPKRARFRLGESIILITRRTVYHKWHTA